MKKRRKILGGIFLLLMMTGVMCLTGCTSSDWAAVGKALGSGSSGNNYCSRCGNSNYYSCSDCNGNGWTEDRRTGDHSKCRSCNGSGKIRCSH